VGVTESGVENCCELRETAIDRSFPVPAGASQRMRVDVRNEPETTESPNLHAMCSRFWKPEPTSVTEVAPSSEPEAGSRDKTAGCGRYEKSRPDEVVSFPVLDETSRGVAPAAEVRGVVQVSVFEVSTVAGTTTSFGLSPNTHDMEPEMKFSPYSWTIVPPSRGPERGVMAESEREGT
jgi:hypothetical protein